jgi:membrane protein required for colicin V production
LDSGRVEWFDGRRGRLRCGNDKILRHSQGLSERMSWVDYSILVILGLSVLVGVLRGFVREVLGLATWVTAFVATYFLGAAVADRLVPYIPAAEVRLVVGQALLFFGALFVGAVLTHLIGVLVRESPVAPVDRTLGGGFGLLRGLVAVVLIVMLADASSTTREQRWWSESALIPPVLPMASMVRSWIPPRWLAPLNSSTSIASSTVPKTGGK